MILKLILSDQPCESVALLLLLVPKYLTISDIDGITYGITWGFFPPVEDFLFPLFNRISLSSYIGYAALETTKIMRDFGKVDDNMTLAIDIASASNCVLSRVLLDKFKEFGVPASRIKFISLLPSNRRIFFKEGDQTKDRVVRVPQGGPLYPILFNLDLRKLDGHLPEGDPWLEELGLSISFSKT